MIILNQTYILFLRVVARFLVLNVF